MGEITEEGAAQTAEPKLRQVDPGVVEPTAHIWLTVMWIAGGMMFFCGLAALNNWRALRAWNIGAGLAMIIATALTLVAICVLIRWGGFPSSIKPLGYALVVVVHSGFGWVLLIGTLIRPR